MTERGSQVVRPYVNTDEKKVCERNCVHGQRKICLSIPRGERGERKHLITRVSVMTGKYGPTLLVLLSKRSDLCKNESYEKRL